MKIYKQLLPSQSTRLHCRLHKDRTVLCFLLDPRHISFSIVSKKGNNLYWLQVWSEPVIGGRFSTKQCAAKCWICVLVESKVIFRLHCSKTRIKPAACLWTIVRQKRIVTLPPSGIAVATIVPSHVYVFDFLTNSFPFEVNGVKINDLSTNVILKNEPIILKAACNSPVRWTGTQLLHVGER